MKKARKWRAAPRCSRSIRRRCRRPTIPRRPRWRAQANLSAAADKLRRYADLVSDRAISERDHAESVAEERQARAEVALAKANLQSARLRLEYARVTSPIDGRARRALVTEGALVGEARPRR